MTNREQCRTYRKLKSLKFLYEISQDGKHIRNSKSKRHVHCFIGENGYYQTNVKIDDELRLVSIDTLVAEAWIGNKPDGYELVHVNGNNLDNHYTNLQYLKISELDKRESLSKPIKLIQKDTTITFPSIRQAAQYLATVYNKRYKTIRSKFSNKRHRIYDYDVIYLQCVETGHGDQY